MLYIPYPFKRCTQCDREFPATLKYFYRDKHGLRSRCKDCVREHNFAYRAAHPGLTHDWYCAHPDYQRAWYAAHAEKRRAERRAYYATHTERECDYARRRYVVRAERARDYSRRYRATHRVELRQYYAGRIDHFRAYHRQYRHNNVDKHRIWKQNRRARIQTLPNSFTEADWLRCLNYWQGCCAVCGAQQGLWIKLHADHWIPLSAPDCPGTVPKNMIVLCGACNSSKNDRDAQEWLAKRYGPRKAKQILKRIESYFLWVEP